MPDGRAYHIQDFISQAIDEVPSSRSKAAAAPVFAAILAGSLCHIREHLLSWLKTRCQEARV